jgi:hypothetical protein
MPKEAKATFSVSVDDGFYEWTYKIKASSDFSIRALIEEFCKAVGSRVTKATCRASLCSQIQAERLMSTTGGIVPEITEAKLIAQQALKIANLEAEVTRMNDDRRSIHMVIYGIGGPLNDNRRGYTREQMTDFALIAQHID